jgi:hypothetical protein
LWTNPHPARSVIVSGDKESIGVHHIQNVVQRCNAVSFFLCLVHLCTSTVFEWRREGGTVVAVEDSATGTAFRRDKNALDVVHASSVSILRNKFRWL